MPVRCWAVRSSAPPRFLAPRGCLSERLCFSLGRPWSLQNIVWPDTTAGSIQLSCRCCSLSLFSTPAFEDPSQRQRMMSTSSAAPTAQSDLIKHAGGVAHCSMFSATMPGQGKQSCVMALSGPCPQASISSSLPLCPRHQGLQPLGAVIL